MGQQQFSTPNCLGPRWPVIEGLSETLTVPFLTESISRLIVNVADILLTG